MTNCKECGRLFEEKSDKIGFRNRPGKKLYCSPECKEKNMRAKSKARNQNKYKYTSQKLAFGG